MIFQAHRGVSTENPENTMPAFIAAMEQGYKIIELDVDVTKDLQFVLLHDNSINRTGRYEDGSPITEQIRISDITYEEALQYDFGMWFSKKFKGVKIPLFEEVLKLAGERGVVLKIDNKYQRFDDVQRKAFFELIKPYEKVAGLTCNSVEEIKRVFGIFPGMHYHYDGEANREKLRELRGFLPKEQLTVWLPHKNPNTWWVKVPYADKALADMVKEYARLGIWLMSRNEDLDEAVKLGADVIETNGQLKPEGLTGIRADMHTHSEASHDSECDIEEMYLAQRERGTDIMAVTDHFDTASFKDYDVFSPLKKAEKRVRELNQKYNTEYPLLFGIEISEGCWYPEIYQKAQELAEYDVILGSVHLVQYKDLTMAYSKIDFSTLTQEEAKQYVDAYFDDILTMLEFADFDILAHLTCPLRYINGKYHTGIDVSAYQDKIDQILKTIIRKGIALEVNTSSLEVLGDFMPDREILKRYYDMGGYLITLGSDAHVSANASAHFAEAIQVVKEIGFRHIYYYKQRKIYQITI